MNKEKLTKRGIWNCDIRIDVLALYQLSDACSLVSPPNKDIDKNRDTANIG